MPNEEIITALKNAIERGESLQTAMQVLVNSGYNPNEVQEASKFVGGASSIPQIKPEEYLTMPEKKSFMSRFKKQPGTIQSNLAQQSPQAQPVQTQPVVQPSAIQEAKQIRQETVVNPPNAGLSQKISPQSKDSQSLTKQLSKISASKHSHTKEIILLITLLILIGVLILTIVFKDKILSFFS